MKKIVQILLVIAVFLSACDYDFSGDIKTEATLTPSYAVPLIDANFMLEELLPDSGVIKQHLEIDEAGYMTLVYRESVEEIGVADFLAGAPTPLPLSGPFLPAFQYTLPESIIDLNLDLDLNGGSITFFDPKVKFILTSFWNIPLEFSFSNMKYYVEGDPIGKDVTGTFINENHSIGSPTVLNDSIVTTIEMNTSNSNIDEVLSAVPTSISTGVIVSTPGQSTPFDLTGAKDNKVDIEIAIPLYLSMENILFSDTTDLNLDVNTDSVKVKNLTINLNADNGFPLGMKTQVYFLDENYTIIDSLFDTRYDLVPASVTNGIVTESDHRQSNISVRLPENRMDNILNAKYLMLYTFLRTTDAENHLPVKIYSNYNLGIQLNAKVDLELIL